MAVDDPVIMALVQQASNQLGAGRLQQAEALCQQVLRQAPGHPDALHLLGVIAQQVGRSQLAVELLSQAITQAPQRSGFMYFNRAVALDALQRPAEAMADYQRTVSMLPEMAQAHAHLGRIYWGLGRLEAAAASCELAIYQQPGLAGAHFTLGMVRHAQERLDDAAACFRRVLELNPGSAEALHHLGDVLNRQGSFDAAEASYRQALALDPTLHMTHNNLGNLLYRQSRLEESVAAYRAAIALQPGLGSLHSNLFLVMQYMSSISQAELFAAQQLFAAYCEAPLKPLWPAHANSPDPQRRLKVGYVSGDFRNHAVAYFIEPVLAHHDPARVEVYCYYNHVVSDAVTARLKAMTAHWLDCAGLSDAELAARIQADGIDILVDLSGHTAFNRLLTFARRPAPVQLTWLGNPGTTGLESMDYRLTDAFLDPEGLAEPWHTETLLRLPASASFQPAPESPAVNELPALGGEPFTLACLNSLVKINAGVVAVWARILKALPTARLMLGNVTDDAAATRLRGLFADAGVEAGQLTLLPKLPLPEYLALHQQIDLALDPWPYGGGTTTNHSLWMGVPVITLSGESTASRQGAAVLTAIGLTGLIARNEEDYESRVLELAGDLPRLNNIRQGLRARMAAAPGPDAAGLTRSLEQAYATIWQTWCTTRAKVENHNDK
jgi:predicted O-linked N-acetylglucosamine transferase (SPINDLY family)